MDRDISYNALLQHLAIEISTLIASIGLRIRTRLSKTKLKLPQGRSLMISVASQPQISTDPSKHAILRVTIRLLTNAQVWVIE